MHKLLFIALSLFLSFQAQGQYTVKGKVFDASSKSPIDYATIVAFDKISGEMIGGTTTENGGQFNFQVPSEKIKIEISFIGFKKFVIEDIKANKTILDIGEIFLNEEGAMLSEVVVSAEKSTTEFKLDKRVFNVGSDLSSTGSSALEVLNNVPSVNVSLEGQISLRGATGVQILIDGKPSVLTDESSNALGTITADMIDRVEVITNPSAKYEAQGTAGIINIVLKKNEKKGVNGSISLNTGYPQNHSLGFSLNNRTDKFNLFTQLGIGYRKLPSDLENINRDLINDYEVNSIGREFRNENFYNVILGSDYYINENNVITLSGSFAYEIEEQPSETDFMALRQGVVEQVWKREEVTSATNPKLQYELQYKRDFEDNEDHKLLFSAIGTYFGKDQSSEFNNSFSSGDRTQPNQQTATSFNEGKYTFTLDYTKPFNELWTVETGVHYLINDVNNDFSVKDQDDTGLFVVNEGLTNVFDYSQDVLGLYATGAYTGEIWGLKLGLRAENTALSTLLENTNESNNQNFTNFFPSVHTSYKFSDAISFQAGYSRRILRPRMWDLNPFFNIRNNFNIRVGNPNLLPEFTDSYEVGAIFIFEAITFNTSLFHRYTTDKIDRVSTFADGVNVWTSLNIGTNKANGVEFNFKYSPFRKLTINGDANYNVFQREGVFNEQNFDFSADQWSTKLTNKYKLSKSVDVELTARYQSREQTIQGVRADNLFADFGFRYKILKGKGVFNFSVRDIFASRVRQTTIENEFAYIYSRNQRGRFITMGFSYGFGKGEAMQYSGARRRF